VLELQGAEGAGPSSRGTDREEECKRIYILPNADKKLVVAVA